MSFWPRRVGSIALAVGGCYLIQMLALSQDSFTQDLIIRAGLFVTLAVSLNLINGITGQFSIGHAAFYMIGAYTTGVLARAYFGSAHLPPPIWLVVMCIAGGLAAGLAGFVVGLPSLRLKGDYLAIVTLGFGEIVSIFVKNQQSLGQAYGMNVEPRFRYTWMVWLLAVICIAVCRNLLKNAHGLAFLAVRDDEVASSAMGVNVTRTKVIAFVLGSAFAGAAGAMLAHFEGFIGPAMFTMDVSFIILTMVVLGGTGSITGSALSAMMLFYIPEAMRDIKTVSMGSALSVLLMVVVAVVLIRRTTEGFHGSNKQKTLRYMGIMAAVVLGHVVLSFIFARVPALMTMIEGSKLRFVVFAVTLLVLMLIRPQGVFGHHELTWEWVRKVLRMDKPKVSQA